MTAFEARASAMALTTGSGELANAPQTAWSSATTVFAERRRSHSADRAASRIRLLSNGTPVCAAPMGLSLAAARAQPGAAPRKSIGLKAFVARANPKAAGSALAMQM